MTGVEIGLASIVVILVLIYSGMHVAVALCLVSLTGVWMVKGNFALASKLLALAASDAVSGYVFGVVPLFVLMGLLVSVADLGRDTFLAANVLLRRVKGGAGSGHCWCECSFCRGYRNFHCFSCRVHKNCRAGDDTAWL